VIDEFDEIGDGHLEYQPIILQIEARKRVTYFRGGYRNCAALVEVSVGLEDSVE